MYKSIKYFAIAGSVVISSVLMGTVISVAVTVPIQGYENLATQRCLDSNPNGNVYTSANRCTSSSTNNYQKWQIITVGSRRRLKNRATSRCLDSNANGTVYTNPCASGDDNNFQQWVRVASGSTTQLRNFATGRCLDSNANGTVYTNPCGSTNNFQKWVERSY